MALGRIRDPRLLVDIATAAVPTSTALAAIQRLDNDQALTDVPESAANREAALDALRRFHDAALCEDATTTLLPKACPHCEEPLQDFRLLRDCATFVCVKCGSSSTL